MIESFDCRKNSINSSLTDSKSSNLIASGGNKCQHEVEKYQRICAVKVNNECDVNTNETDLLKKCCSGWDKVDCYINKLDDISECTAQDREGFRKIFMDEIKEFEMEVCKDYPHGSPKCNFPWWAVALIVVGGLVFVALVALLIYKTLIR
jgi:hypothetical protein